MSTRQRFEVAARIRRPLWRALILLACLQAGQVGAVVFEPEKCPEPDPEGKAYLSLGEAVLRVPLRTLNITSAPLPDWPLPTPPDASQPPGCSGHPLAKQGVMTDFAITAWLRDRKQPSTSQLRSIGLSRARRDSYERPGWFQSAENYYALACERRPKRVSLSNGLQGCLVTDGPENDYVGRKEVGVYRADPKAYEMPLGQTFIVDCMPDIPAGAVCDVDYKVLPTVNLRYRFNTKFIPLEEVIEFDRMLREQIEQAVVTDYKWQDDNAGQEDRQ
ncbi:hypothetical protein SAMN05216600_11910 [Pseudomonas cuatrocienegasensis]|uniref:Uncharacterized protein n=1 Tax=Pseudomonas cuatrocienegasensis TaxID=543360 RepID=A0ABY1BNB1_9PSED|nr:MULTISPECIES: hypothetical protein [Pseudomonas]OEC33664.1 hypothetical protein A7D25_17485 [Pseudomonas sp. 21C1]SER24503.1 hypothetical protein SAMN05216600_11910 [Pseudomonas cuatrocienegasensis]